MYIREKVYLIVLQSNRPNREKCIPKNSFKIRRINEKITSLSKKKMLAALSSY